MQNCCTTCLSHSLTLPSPSLSLLQGYLLSHSLTLSPLSLQQGYRLSHSLPPLPLSLSCRAIFSLTHSPLSLPFSPAGLCSLSLEEVFGPHNTVDGLRGSVANAAGWIGLGCWLGLTLIALTLSLQRDQR